MKSKCSFILKAGLSLVLALVLLFGTVATSFAVAVDDSSAAQPAKEQAEKPAEEPAVYSDFVASTGETLAAAAEAADAADEVDDVVLPSLKKVVDLAETGKKADLAETGWSVGGGRVYLYDQDNIFKNDNYVYMCMIVGSWNDAYIKTMTKITGTSIYYIDLSSKNWNIYTVFFFGTTSSWGGTTDWASQNNGLGIHQNMYNNAAHTTQVHCEFNFTNGKNYVYTCTSDKDNDNNKLYQITSEYEGDNPINDWNDYKKTQYARVYYRTGGSNGAYTNKNSAGNTYGTLKLSGKQWNDGTSLKSSATESTAPANTSIADIARTSTLSVTATKGTGYDLTAVRYNANNTAVTTNNGGTELAVTNATAKTLTVTSVNTFSAFFDEHMYTVTVACGANGTTSTDGTTYNTSNKTVSAGITTHPSIYAQPDDGYAFAGWTVTSGTASNAIWEDGGQNATSTTIGAKGNITITANFAQVYYLSAFDSYEMVNGAVEFITAPPKTIEVTHGGTKYTYNFDGTKTKGNPDTPNISEPKPAAITMGSGSYGAGNYIPVYSGDTVKLIYSAMASSELIRGVFFNNDVSYEIRKPTDAEFVQHDYTAAHTLYADAQYYDPDAVYSGPAAVNGDKIVDIIGAQSYPVNASAIDQNEHSVTFTMTGDVKNVDIEVASKHKVYFSDYDNTLIQSKNIEDYYYNGEQLSGATEDKYLFVKADGNTNQTNTITLSGINVYKADENGEPITTENINSYFTFTHSTSGSSIANSGGSASTAYIKVEGTMPSYDIYIDLGLAVSYSVYLGSKVVADAVAGMDAMGDVANVYMKMAAAGDTPLRTASTDVTCVGPESVASGTSRRFDFTWNKTNDNKSYGLFYMFVGWYKGTSSGPDFKEGFITSDDVLTYTPKANTYVWAVCTRDLYIAGSRYITGQNYDWGGSGKTSANSINVRMNFDPDYGTKGRYYWTITDEMFQDASYDFTTNGSHSQHGVHWTFDESNKGKAWFQFRDEATGDNNNCIWSAAENNGVDMDFYTTATGIAYGRIRESDAKWMSDDQYGYIYFKESTYPGYSSPITIYYDPATHTKGQFAVEASYVYPRVYMSNGYKVGATNKETGPGHNSGFYAAVTNTDGTKTNITNNTGSGWLPNNEGHVANYTISQKNATVRVKKVCAATEKVSAFFIYDIADNSVRAEKTITESPTNTYYADIQLKTGHDLYIVPIIEVKTADMTVYFDASQLNTDRWGKIVTCYAWYSYNDTPALGAFPGQPMIPSEDGNTWTATFPSTMTNGGITYRLAGITFSNYYDKNATAGHSWLGMDGVLDTVTYTNEGKENQSINYSGTGIIQKYNAIGAATKADGTINHQYEKANCKVQTYDYREPISYYTSAMSTGGDITLKFAIKMGNSDNLMSLRHSELKVDSRTSSPANIFSGIYHTHSDPSEHSTANFTTDNFEYLTNAKGDKYKDLNGNDIPTKPTATYMVLAKGQVVYDTKNLSQVFWSGNRNESRTTIAYGNDSKGRAINSVPTGGGAVNEVYPENISSMSYAVQWYVYDATGNYITNILSAGYADESNETGFTELGKILSNMGYVVDGKAVAICYDKPRALNEDAGGKINSNDTFNAYRATGQWYKTEQVEPVTVSVKVGMFVNGEEVLSDKNAEGYGSATAQYDTSKGSANGTLRAVVKPTPYNTPYPAVTTAIKDAANNPIKLNASSENFQGWYYYDEGTGKFTKAKYESNANFYPDYTKDITFYAMYKASAIYRYHYLGREGAKTYSVGGGDLLTEEMQNGYSISKSRGDVTTKAPVGKISVFKQTLDFTKNASDVAYSASDYKNKDDVGGDEYYLDIDNCKKTAETYTVTAYYKDASGTQQTYTTEPVAYNGGAISLTDASGNGYGGLYKDSEFIGWYDADTGGNLLSTNKNFGMQVTRSMSIYAKYASDGYSLPVVEDTWHAYIDENVVTREMYSADSGVFYNDTIVRVRNDQGVLTPLPEGAEVGVIMISNKDGLADTTSRTNPQLISYANALKSGQSAKIGDTGLKATKVSTTTVTKFNRADLAIRSDYQKMVGTRYSIYAYIKVGESYVFCTTPVTHADANGYPAVA